MHTVQCIVFEQNICNLVWQLSLSLSLSSKEFVMQSFAQVGQAHKLHSAIYLWKIKRFFTQIDQFINWSIEHIIYLGVIFNYNMRNNNTVQVTRWRWNQLITSKYGWKRQFWCRRSDVGRRAFLSGLNLQPYFISPVENHAWPAEKGKYDPVMKC